MPVFFSFEGVMPSLRCQQDYLMKLFLNQLSRLWFRDDAWDIEFAKVILMSTWLSLWCHFHLRE